MAKRGIAARGLYLGLMSGTAMDGIDAAILETDGDRIFSMGESLIRPYDANFRSRLAAIVSARGEDGTATSVLEAELTDRHAEMVRDLLRQAGLSPGDVRAIGFHGHTVLHAPRRGGSAPGRTWQIGDGTSLARMTGIDVVHDFRSDDVRDGGEGAPFAPVFHQALAADIEKPLLVLNLGGVGNVTYMPAEGAPIAFDTGPGNALIDDWMARRLGRPFDRGGAYAANGAVDESAVAAFLTHPYFSRPPPKSLDRGDFEGNIPDPDGPDGAATVTALTAASVADGMRWLPHPPRRALVCGGGRRNATIMRGLTERLAITVAPVESVGWLGDSVEALAFAYMAARRLADLPISFPGTTGVSRPMTGGRIAAADGDARSCPQFGITWPQRLSPARERR